MKKKNVMQIVCFMLVAFECFFLSSVMAEDFPEITAEQLKAKMDAGEKLLLINPLNEIDFAAKHIPGSVNIPLQIMPYTDKLPKDKTQLIITYCLGRQ